MYVDDSNIFTNFLLFSIISDIPSWSFVNNSDWLHSAQVFLAIERLINADDNK